MKNLKEYVHEIEHLPYEHRKQEHVNLFESKAALSQLVWDIFAHNVYIFYLKKNATAHNSTLSQKGIYQGQLSESHTKLLKQIFDSCQLEEFDPHRFNSDENYEPRKNLHEDMVRINNYYEPSELFLKNFPQIFEPLVPIIEKECGCYWRVASIRIFAVKPVNHTQGFHIDGQPYGVRKIFFYPNGVSKNLGSTQVITKDGENVVVEGPAGTWIIFENNLIEHQAFSSLDITSRPTIEIDIVPDFETDPTLVFNGINSWFPWFPLNPKHKNISLGTPELNLDNVSERTLQRVVGLSTIYKLDNYRFSDLRELSFDPNCSVETKNNMNVASGMMAAPIPATNEAIPQNSYYSPSQNFKEAFKQLSQARGLSRTLLKSLSLSLNMGLKKLKSKRKSLIGGKVIKRSFSKLSKSISKSTLRSIFFVKKIIGKPQIFFLISDANRYDRFFLLTEFFKEKLKKDFIVISKVKSGHKAYYPIVIPSYDSLTDEKFVTSTEIINAHSLPEITLIFDLSIEAITFENQTSELLVIFHNILKKYKFDPKRIILLTSNRNASKSYKEWSNKFSPDFQIEVIGYNFYLFEYHLEIIKNKTIIDNYNSNLKNLTSIKNKKHFISLNLRPRWHRKALVLFLLSENLLKKCAVTFFGEAGQNHWLVDSPQDSERNISLLKGGEKMLSFVKTLDDISPLTFERDEKNLKKDLWERMPGEVDFLIPEIKAFGSFTEPMSYFEVVAETWFSDEKCSFMTEKTIRSILRLNPFILLGSPHTLSYLRSIGFKTFSPLIDESYDSIESPIDRMEAIFKEIKRLCAMSDEEMQHFYRNLAPILHHNFQHFIDSNKMAEIFEKEVKDKVLNFLKK